MTIYSVKINKHEVVKTTALHEAINLAKKALIDRLAVSGLYPTSVCEKMYLNNGKVCYRVFATIHEKNWQGYLKRKTYSNSICMENVPMGNYNFALHSEISKALDEVKKNKGAD